MWIANELRNFAKEYESHEKARKNQQLREKYEEYEELAERWFCCYEFQEQLKKRAQKGHYDMMLDELHAENLIEKRELADIRDKLFQVDYGDYKDTRVFAGLLITDIVDIWKKLAVKYGLGLRTNTDNLRNVGSYRLTWERG